MTRLFFAGIKISTSAFFLNRRTGVDSGVNVGLLRRGGEGVVAVANSGLSADPCSTEAIGESSVFRLRPDNMGEDTAGTVSFMADSDVILEAALESVLGTEEVCVAGVRIADVATDAGLGNVFWDDFDFEAVTPALLAAGGSSVLDAETVDE